MKEYIKKHLLSLITIVTAILTDVTLNILSKVGILTNGITLGENIVIAGLILLITTNLLEYNSSFDSIRKSIEKYNATLSDSSIHDFISVDQCAEYVLSIIKTGNHTVDYISIDKKRRTSNTKQKRPMLELLEKFVSSDKIKLRFLTVVNQANFQSIVEYMILSKLNEKHSFYGCYELDISFASFYIVDSKYLVIRTPYDKGTNAIYCVVENAKICALFQTWYNLLWTEASMLDTCSKIENLGTKFNLSTPEYIKMIAQLKKFEVAANE